PLPSSVILSREACPERSRRDGEGSPSGRRRSLPLRFPQGRDDGDIRNVLPIAPMAVDSLGRPLRDLRISVTDRCNFRCTYCMPKEVFGRDFAFLARSELLTFE